MGSQTTRTDDAAARRHKGGTGSDNQSPPPASPPGRAPQPDTRQAAYIETGRPSVKERTQG
jgi:hypothetical protein